MTEPEFPSEIETASSSVWPRSTRRRDVSCNRRFWRTPRAFFRAAFVALLVFAASGCGLIVNNIPTFESGKPAGAVSGLLIAAMLAYALVILMRGIDWRGDSWLRIGLGLLGVIAMLKLAALPFFGGYGTDVSSYESWALDMVRRGPARIYRLGYFLDYPPGYLYALWLAGLAASTVRASGTLLRVIVETPALVADFILALVTYAIVRRRNASGGRAAIVAMLLVALNPALLFDTVVWGQSDSVLTALMLLSTAMALDSEFELAWGIAALGVLVKPQGLMFLPVLGFFTVLNARLPQWWRSALSFIAVGLIAVIPFQMGHSWRWLFDLYRSTAAYYHETSVNAFNLMALIGGLRQPDSAALFGAGPVSIFVLGMALLVPLYAFATYVIWRRRSAEGLLFGAFIALFGFFMLAPRMHERYMYPAIAFAVPLAIEDGEMALVFAILSATCLLNLAYVKHALETVVFLQPRDGVAMGAAVLNVIALALACDSALAPADVPSAFWRRVTRTAEPLTTSARRVATPPAPAAKRAPAIAFAEMSWTAPDTLIILALLAVAAATRFWRLGHPAEIVFDEVHFVGQARHYLRGETFLDPHPPLAKLIIAAGIWLFGDHPWSWRVGNAILGTLLVGITYLLGRRLFRSRLAAIFAAAFITCDGMYLVDSRIAVIDIVYLTFAAWSYLLLFRFAQSRPGSGRRPVLIALGVTLGLCVGAKLYVPAVTFILVMGFLAYFIARSDTSRDIRARRRRMLGALTMVGAVSSIVYIAVFIPHFMLGWWRGIEDLFAYYGDVVWYERSVASATHPYSSPWWSWPLMLRPIAYWQNFPPVGKVATIWGGGNPLLWWGALTAITIMAVRAVEHPNPVRSFIVLGYLGSLVIWVPIGRTLFLYHYMPSIYFGYLALAIVLADCWNGEADPWEALALVMTMVPAMVLGMGAVIGAISAAALFAVYILALIRDQRLALRIACAAFTAGAAILFVYYFPVWTAISIDRAGYYARMWLQGPGLRNWI